MFSVAKRTCRLGSPALGWTACPPSLSEVHVLGSPLVLGRELDRDDAGRLRAEPARDIPGDERDPLAGELLELTTGFQHLLVGVVRPVAGAGVDRKLDRDPLADPPRGTPGPKQTLECGQELPSALGEVAPTSSAQGSFSTGW